MLPHPRKKKKKPSDSESKLSPTVFVIDSPKSCAAHRHGIKDDEAGLTTHAVLVV